MSRPADYDELLSAVCEGLATGDLAAVRRRLIRARAKAAEPDERRGSLLGFEIACESFSDEEAARQRVLEATGESADEKFLSGCGCALSDVAHQRSQVKLLELAELVFSAAKVPAPDWRFPANHAVVLERLERFEDAAEAFGRAAALAGDEEPGLQARRAGSLRKAGELDAARDAYLGYLAVRPDDADEWISLAIVESDAGRYDDAQKAYWRAGGLEPDNLSLHYNWFITALRAGRRELATDACNRLNAIDESDWRSGLASASLLGELGDSRAGFHRAAETFDREAEACDLSDAEERSRLEHIATWALDLALRCDRAESEGFVDRLCRDWILNDDILASIRKRESPGTSELAEYDVLVEAVEASPEPPTVAYLMRYRIFASSAERAAELASAFERRCGAGQVRACEVKLVDEAGPARHPGPTWRSHTAYSFPVEEFGSD